MPWRIAGLQTVHYRWLLYLHCHIQPKARADEFCGLHGERLKVRLTAPA